LMIGGEDEAYSILHITELNHKSAIKYYFSLRWCKITLVEIANQHS